MPKLKTDTVPPSEVPVKKAKVKKPKKGETPKPETVEDSEPSNPVVYPKLDVRVYLASEGNPFTEELAGDLMGWETETETEKFGNNFLLTDRYGKKVRCTNNLANRPFYPVTANDWALEILRRKWRFNGESMIVDKFGLVHDAQHRCIGLKLAVQEWELDQKKPADKQVWSQFWPDGPPTIDALVVLGIEGTDDVVNTIGTGKPRTITDVLFRCTWFADKDKKQREFLSKVTAFAVKLLWLRTAQNLVSFAPRRPHSETLDFIARHERILECVKFITDEADGGKLNQFIPLGYAAALLYLMGSAATDSDVYDKVNAESALDWKLWDKAQEFWADLSSNGKATEGLRDALLSIPVEAAGGYARDLRCGLVIKAWNLFSDGETITEEAIELETKQDGFGRPELAELPRIGGIDIGKV